MNEGTHPGIRSLLPLLLIAVLATVASGQTSAGVQGKWRTEMEQPGGRRIVVIMELTQDAEANRWTGNVRNSVAPQESEELRSVTVAERNVRFHTLTDVPGQNVQIRTDFDLVLRPAGDELRGTMKITMPGFQREMPLALTRVVEQAGAEGLRFQPARPFLGAWRAQPDRDDRQREIVLEILPDVEAYQGTLTDSGIGETVALRDLIIDDKERTISFNFRFAGAPFLSSFWGRWDEQRDRVRGSMSIGGRSQALAFDRISPGPESLLDDFATRRRQLVRKHAYDFGASLRVARWVPLYVLKEKVRNINDITSATFAFDAGLRFHLLDYLAVQARVVRGGLGFDTNAQNLGLFDPLDGSQGSGFTQALTTASHLKLDGYELSLLAFLGQSLLPQSKFNPYLIAVAGRTDWELTEDGRGSRRIEIFEVPLEGSDWTFGGGLGTEYSLSPRLSLEFEWVWAYTLTEDATKWSNVTQHWTNQHVLRFSLGGIFYF